MPNYTTYNETTGQLLGVWGCPEGKKPLTTDPYIPGAFKPKTQYINPRTREVMERPDFSYLPPKKQTLRVGQPLSIPGVPWGTEISLAGHTYRVDDGEFEWSSPVPGSWQGTMINFPYRECEFTVEVRAQG